MKEMERRPRSVAELFGGVAASSLMPAATAMKIGGGGLMVSGVRLRNEIFRHKIMALF